jgi:tol-pal system protein YbgF
MKPTPERPAIPPQRRRARAIARPAPTGRGTLTLLGLAAFILFSLMMFAPKADAQVFSSTPYTAAPDPAVEQLRLRLEQLEADLKRAVDRAESLGAQLAEARRIAQEANNGQKEALRQVEALSDRVETLEGALAAAQQQSAVGSDGVQVAEATSLAGPGPAAPPVDVAALPQDEPGLFEQSHDLLISGNFAGAESAFTSYLAKYPKGPKAADAQYYLGEALLYQDNYADAAAAYGKLIKDHPSSQHAPTGLVKLARSMRLMGKPADACKTLALMSKQFPKASAAAKQMAATESQYAKCK